ncbi:MAG: Na+/H+ antiporter subunit E [Gammaproteobacteria bacterium]|nr:Na+/H+ antiporter subunit E [Gammaproteobacteria bacterium]
MDNSKTSWPSILVRASLFALIWSVLSGGATASWWIGIPAVLLAVIVSVALIPPTPLVWSEILRFAPFFLQRSLLGGTDVAWRAFHPRRPIAPDLIEYPLQLQPGLPQVFMVNTVSLLPGTLSAVLEHNVLKVHVLDRQKNVVAELKALEQIVARMFDTSLNIS